MIEIKFELPFSGVNQRLLKDRIASDFGTITHDDLVVYVYDDFVIGVRADVDASAVSQSAIDTATQSINDALGATVVVLDWGEPPLN